MTIERTDQQIEPAATNEISLSVVICCYNSACRLPQTLGHLAEQKTPPQLRWEIVVVDNASKDGTADVAERFALAHPNLSVRIVREPQPGLMHARLRGLRASRGDIILFVDDDNWLDPEYVALTAETMATHPEVGGLGGVSTAVFEQNPPAWMTRYQRWYAVSGLPEPGTRMDEVNFIWGAGAAFRRSDLERILNDAFRLSGRRAGALSCGDDHELCYRLRHSGRKLFCHPGLRFRHYLPAGRTEWTYLRGLHYAEGEASVLLDVYRLNEPDSRGRWPIWLLRSWHAQMFNVCCKLLRHPLVLWRARRNPLEGDDRALQSEVFRGRFAALRRVRSSYKKMLMAR